MPTFLLSVSRITPLTKQRYRHGSRMVWKSNFYIKASITKDTLNMIRLKVENSHARSAMGLRYGMRPCHISWHTTNNTLMMELWSQDGKNSIGIQLIMPHKSRLLLWLGNVPAIWPRVSILPTPITIFGFNPTRKSMTQSVQILRSSQDPNFWNGSKITRINQLYLLCALSRSKRTL